MAEMHRLQIGETLAIQKGALNNILASLRARGYLAVGARVKNEGLVYEPLDNLEQLPRGYSTEQAAGRFRLISSGHGRYFDFTPGVHSWKRFLFPPTRQLFSMRNNGNGWRIQDPPDDAVSYAFIGVRPCELSAIRVQDKIFLRPDFTDETYRVRREATFILAVNCLHPAQTCFCAAMSTGPRAESGFDLSLTELDDVFLLTIGSELGRSLAADLPAVAASAFLLGNAEQGFASAVEKMKGGPDSSGLPNLIEENLEHEHWQATAERCLSCGNCTLVCPTCFCWDVLDYTDLAGKETRRERIWDSCFNPAHSYQAGGNTRPSIRARYRQWFSHKFGTWGQQHGTPGCVGCGRCVTWCPAGIDVRTEISSFQKEVGR